MTLKEYKQNRNNFFKKCYPKEFPIKYKPLEDELET
jgi:hypothetical protein